MMPLSSQSSQIPSSNLQTLPQIDPKYVAVPLKALALVGIATGLFLATTGGIGGVYILGKTYLASELGAKIFAVSTSILCLAGIGFLYMSKALLTASGAALGAAITVPIAAACFILPLIPFSPGLVLSIPGGILCVASSLALKKLEENDNPSQAH